MKKLLACSLLVAMYTVWMCSCTVKPATSTATITTNGILTSDGGMGAAPTKGWNYDWLAAGSTTPAMLAAKFPDFCPKLTPALAKDFWVAFEKSITRAESGWDPASGMTENFKNSAGAFVKSIGLLQLSIEDVKNYPSAMACKDMTLSNIKDPVVNLRCGMAIQEQLLKKHPEQSARAALGRYWSTVRDNKNPTDGITLAATVKKYFPPCFQ